MVARASSPTPAGLTRKHTIPSDADINSSVRLVLAYSAARAARSSPLWIAARKLRLS